MMEIKDLRPADGVEIPVDEPKVSARTGARRAALQALYTWQMMGNSPVEILQYFAQEDLLEGADFPLFKQLVLEVSEQAEELDQHFLAFIDRDIKRIDPVEKAVLRIACYELKHSLEIPYRVVINEAVELAKRFGAEESHKYINGVLDRVAKRLRSVEQLEDSKTKKRK
jgi:N utilization substance protein B